MKHLPYLLSAALIWSASAQAQGVAPLTPSAAGDASSLTVTMPVGTASPTTLSAWASQFANARLMGAKGDGATDDTAAVQAALNAGSNGYSQTVIIPKGVYKIYGHLVVPSGVTVRCQDGAVLREMTSDTLFINANATRSWSPDNTAPTTANMSDHDITIEGCTGDFTQASPSSTNAPTEGSGMFGFLLANNLHIRNNKMLANTLYGAGGGTGIWGNFIRVSKAYDVEVSGNWGNGLYNGFGYWGGGWNVRAHDNTFYVAQGSSIQTTSCSNINGMDTGGHDETITNVTYDHNTCYVAGGVSTLSAVPYDNDSLSPGSAIREFTFADNRTIATGPYVGCYSGGGNLVDVRITNNYFEGCDKFGLVVSPSSTSLGSQTNVLSTTSGSSLVTAAFAGISSANVTVGNYITLSGNPTIGGLTLSAAYYPVTATAAGTLTFDAGSNATSTVPNGGGTTNFGVYWGVPRNVIVSGNTFKNVSAPGNGLIVVLGPNNIVKDNAATGGSYGALTLTSWRDCCSSATPIAAVLSGNRGAAGSGVTAPTGGFAVSGDNTNAWQTGYAPLMLDAPLIQTSGTWTPVLKFGGATTGITYGTQAGQYTITGKLVSFCGQIVLTSKGTATGNATIAGLPFGSNTTSNMTQHVDTTYIANTTGLTSANLAINANNSQVNIYTDVTNATQATDTNFTTNTNFRFCGSYLTN